jgi:hypothetical protein
MLFSAPGISGRSDDGEDLMSWLLLTSPACHATMIGSSIVGTIRTRQIGM